MDDCDFSFFCNPYLLKLHFPYPCIDDERAKAVYDVDKVVDSSKVARNRTTELSMSIFLRWKRVGSSLI